MQFSLFDIGDPASPRRIDTQTYGGGAAAAEFDPRAFLYWEPRGPGHRSDDLYGNGTGRDAFSGLVLLRADADGLTEFGRLAAPGGRRHRPPVGGHRRHRSTLLSDQALQANSLDTHERIDELVL